jgi:hypothetical protein
MTTVAAAPRVHESHGIYELEGEIRSPYINHDLEPARLRDRKWALKDIAALWIDVGVRPDLHARVRAHRDRHELCAGGGHDLPRQLIVLAPMVLNAHAGTRYGISFPVYCRPGVRHPRRERPRDPHAAGRAPGSPKRATPGTSESIELESVALKLSSELSVRCASL